MTIKKESGNLIKLKEDYEKERKKHNLADFDFMNQNFEIENIESEESQLLLKRIRKHMTEKIFVVLRTLEMFINGQNAPLFMFDVIKSFNAVDKELIRDLYKRLAQYEIEAFALEAKYDEKKEAEFIRKFSEDWKKSISSDLMKLYSVMNSGHSNASKKQTKSYLG